MDTVLFLQTIVHSDSGMRYTLSHTERGGRTSKFGESTCWSCCVTLLLAFFNNSSQIHIQQRTSRQREKEEMTRNVQQFDRAPLRLPYQTAMSLDYRLQ
jgi:hypothetical protein